MTRSFEFRSNFFRISNSVLFLFILIVRADSDPRNNSATAGRDPGAAGRDPGAAGRDPGRRERFPYACNELGCRWCGAPRIARECSNWCDKCRSSGGNVVNFMVSLLDVDNFINFSLKNFWKNFFSKITVFLQ